MTRLSAIVALILTIAHGLSISPAYGQKTLTAGIYITSAVKVKSGVYRLKDPGEGMVQVSGKGFEVDLSGVSIVGSGTSRGIGIHIQDAQNVTIRGVHVTGCQWGIVLERCKEVTLVDCVSSHNSDLPPGTVIDESGREPEDQHGGGILLRDCTGCRVVRCKAQHQWDGIDVVRSNGNIIEEGDYSYCNNWGLHLWSSSKNIFRRNRAVWCTTGEGMLYQALTGWQTYDAQAVGIDHASCGNYIVDNDLRFGGDGIFIRANEGGATPGSPVPPLHSSDRNILRGNDCSFSPNNAIEADFIADTAIENNNCSNSHYGLWLGYSRGTYVEGNTCINDTARAIEIENGQDGVIAYNLIGFDKNREDAPLIYLRQNGRDKTPSGPYSIFRNTFYGSARCVLLRDTRADLEGNKILRCAADARLMVEETPGGSKEVNTLYSPLSGSGVWNGPPLPGTVVSGSLTTITNMKSWTDITAVELNGIPAWVQEVYTYRFLGHHGGMAHLDQGAPFILPRDFWDQPVPSKAALRVFTGTGWSAPVPIAIKWPKEMPRIERISPNPARIGDTITVEGTNLGRELLLNGRAVAVKRIGPGKLTFQVPEGVLVSTHYNLIVRNPESPDQATWPVTFAVDVPNETQPHLVSATFSPTTLHIGDTLTVTFTVRNNLPAPAMLVTFPAPGYTYDESKAGWEIGAKEPPGTLHLRVTSDHPGPNDPGSWPWFFGFDRHRLAPGETVTVTGRIRVETPGVHEFRVGLVAGGFRFIDDNAFRTKITVLPK